ncbi:hypothetical protein COU53_03645 [Candidatus Pacearchaeota archaeon CG10_big_fil_rev_8_21_14_0_10_30_48]|nr:MAG: hypothetical protein COU53_03645 [Candidatus Pacearchaeota archaeon CG10_big_fil_rev_8_21_14_0_10_30_48]
MIPLQRLTEIEEEYQPPRLTEIVKDLLYVKGRSDLANALEMSENSPRTDIEKISILLPYIEIPKEILNRKYD